MAGRPQGLPCRLLTQTAEPPPTTVRTLAGAPAGRLVRIEALHAGRSLNRRPAEVGLRSGTVIEVMQNHGPDGVIVGLDGERLALPRDLALCIRIADRQGQPAALRKTS